MIFSKIYLVLLGALSLPATLAAPVYPWLATPLPSAQQLATRFVVPPGCQRVAVAPGSWGEWLRGLPLKPLGTRARLFNGQLKGNQAVVAAVVAIDPGTSDLQQCADAVMRMRAEYLFSFNPNKIHFHLTTGYDAWFSDYLAGTTFRVQGEEVRPAPKPTEAPTHAALSRYLLPVFGYAGTLSLSRELQPVSLDNAQPGDVLVRPPRPCRTGSRRSHKPAHRPALPAATTKLHAGPRHPRAAQRFRAVARGLVCRAEAASAAIRHPRMDVCQLRARPL
jgi:hypothetical protein